MTAFTVTVDAMESDALAITLPKIPNSTLSAMTQVQQTVQIECRDVFDRFPVLRVSYLAGSHQTLTLRLPVFLSKFVEPVQLNAADFFERWKQIGGPPHEVQNIFAIKLDGSNQIDVARNKRIIGGLRFGLLESIDPNSNNIVRCGGFAHVNGWKGWLLTSTRTQ